MSTRHASLAGLTLVTLAALTGCAHSGYVSVPLQTSPRREIPETVRVIGVQFPNYLYRGQESGVVADRGESWYRILVKQLEAGFEHSPRRFTIYDREDALSRLTEKRSSDVADEAAFVTAGADAIIVPRVHIEALDPEPFYEATPAHTRIWKAVANHFVGGLVDNPSMQLRWRVHARVHVDMALKLVATGAQLASYGESIDITRVSRISGEGFKTERPWELRDADELVGRLIQEHADLFLADLLPFERHIEVQLPELHEQTDAACAAVNQMDLNRAAQLLSDVIALQHKDACAFYLMGLVCDLQQDYRNAASWYRKGKDALKPDNDLFVECNLAAVRAEHRAARTVTLDAPHR